LSYDPTRRRLSDGQRVSRCAVWRPHHRQNFFSSIRSGVFRLDLFVW